MKKERVELRYKPHKRGAKESWLPIRDKKEKKEKKAPKVPRVPKEKKQTAPKDPKERRPTRAEVTVEKVKKGQVVPCLLYTSPSPRDLSTSRMPSSA